jgi:hypothetical protein
VDAILQKNITLKKKDLGTKKTYYFSVWRREVIGAKKCQILVQKRFFSSHFYLKK